MKLMSYFSALYMMTRDKYGKELDDDPHDLKIFFCLPMYPMIHGNVFGQNFNLTAEDMMDT